MKISVWTVTSDTDDGLNTSVHALKISAYIEAKRRYCNSTAEESVFNKYIAAGEFDEIDMFLQKELEGSMDSFRIEEHELELPEMPSHWDPLIKLIGPEGCREFMYMSQEKERGFVVYKHINTRRYLCIDPVTDKTYQRDAKEWTEVPTAEAVHYARGTC